MLANKRKLILIVCLALLFSSCKMNEKTNKKIKKRDKEEINIEVKEIDKIDKEQMQVTAKGIDGVFNPLFAITEGDQAVSYSMFMPFMGMKKKMETDPQNSIVSSMSRDGLSLNFTIDEDLNWWDGEPVSAEDVYFSLRILLSKDYKGINRRGELFYITGAKEFYNGETDKISGIEVIDEKHLNIRFDDFQDSFYYALNFRPIPIHYYQGEGINEIHKFDSNPLGNSAYILKDWEKKNYAILEKNDKFKYKANINHIVIREVDEKNVVNEMLRGNIDAANIYIDNESLNQGAIVKNFDRVSVVENEVAMLRIPNFNGMAEIENRERIINIVLNYMDEKSLKISNSLISPTNKAFINVDYGEPLEPEEKKSIPVNLVYEDNQLMGKLAQDLKSLLSEEGYIVVLNETTPYDILDTARSLIDRGRNVLILSSFKHGYLPDFSQFFSSYGDGRLLYQDVNLDEEIFNILVDKKTNLKDAYKLILNDIKNQKLAVGFGAPTLKTYSRKGLRNFTNTEFMQWYDFGAWDIVWQ